MNGSNHLEESERRVFALCPADLRKLESTLQSARLDGPPFDAVAREQAMLEWLEAYGLDEDAAQSCARLAVLRGEAWPPAKAMPVTEDGDAPSQPS